MLSGAGIRIIWLTGRERREIMHVHTDAVVRKDCQEQTPVQARGWECGARQDVLT